MNKLSIGGKCWAALHLVETEFNLKLPPEYKFYSQAYYSNDGNGFVFTIRGKNPLNPAFRPISKDFKLTSADDENSYHVAIIGYMMGGFTVNWWMSNKRHDEFSHPTHRAGEPSIITRAASHYGRQDDYRNFSLENINDAVNFIIEKLANGLDELRYLHAVKAVHNA